MTIDFDAITRIPLDTTAIKGREFQTLNTLLVESTRAGRVQDWNERLAEIARIAGLPLEQVTWGKAPVMVAFSLIECANSRSITSRLRAAAEAYKAQQI